ncbi:MAG: c-type cytochrome, partial [Gammaproteobacteria bacterium]|nr:c-type cytochrome [Gammaproteobacteria bacterium]
QEEKPEQPQLDYGTQVASSPESIAKGKELFLEGDRCAECHGQTGKGSGIKALKSDAGERTWPRNLTKAWTYRATSEPKDVFTRITTGIPGTQMPSFADPISKMKLSVEDRWHVANYVSSIAEAGGDKQPDPENIVVKVAKAEGGLPADPNDPAWDSSRPSNFFLIPQFIGKERLFTPSNDSITVRALYDESEIAILLEWDDRTKSIPGDTAAITVADPNEVYEDSVAVQFPMEIPKGVQKPYFGMGDAGKPVNIWQWKSGTTDKPESVGLMNSTGFANIERRDAAGSGITVKGAYDNGVWRVVIKRPLTTAEADKDIQFAEGKFIPAAFAVWDGSNNEKGSKHTTTAWYWLILEPPTGSKPYLMALLVMVLIGGGQFWWARSANPKKT